MTLSSFTKPMRDINGIPIDLTGYEVHIVDHVGGLLEFQQPRKPDILRGCREVYYAIVPGVGLRGFVLRERRGWWSWLLGRRIQVLYENPDGSWDVQWVPSDHVVDRWEG